LDGPARLRAVAGDRARSAFITTNPEFLREGQALADFDRPSRVVVGWLEPSDRKAAEAVADLYAPLHAPTVVADADSVALIKLLSNVFLGMKIAYANEVARIAEAIGADVTTVIEGVGLDKRIGTSFMQPGPGFGGSCLPEQALAIALETAAIDVPTPLLSAIHRSNATHKQAIVQRLATMLGGSLDGRRVAILGLAFKANTDDVRDSPPLALAMLIREAGATVIAHDPKAAAKAQAVDPLLIVAETPVEAAEGADAVLVATEWADYGTLDWGAMRAAMRGTLVYDTRAVVDVAAAEAAGLRVERLGRRSELPVTTG
ncbi:MAG: nucleotide sugar dehydrogenase, partial [Candidatus Limnocylindrales bacterium]